MIDFFIRIPRKNTPLFFTNEPCIFRFLFADQRPYIIRNLKLKCAKQLFWYWTVFICLLKERKIFFGVEQYLLELDIIKLVRDYIISSSFLFRTKSVVFTLLKQPVVCIIIFCVRLNLFELFLYICTEVFLLALIKLVGGNFYFACMLAVVNIVCFFVCWFKNLIVCFFACILLEQPVQITKILLVFVVYSNLRIRKIVIVLHKIGKKNPIIHGFYIT